MTPETLRQQLNNEGCALMHEELIETIDQRIAVCKGNIANELHDINLMLKELTGAFVLDTDGKPDVIGHRNAHKAMIEAAKAERDFWLEMKRDLAKKGLFGLLVILIGLVFIGIQVKLGILRIGP